MRAQWKNMPRTIRRCAEPPLNLQTPGLPRERKVAHNASIMPIPQAMTEYRDVDAAIFRDEISSRYRPAVLRDFVKDWPAVRHAVESPEAVCRYLTGFDNGSPVDVLLLAPDARGRIAYRDDMAGFNYLRNKLPVSQVIEQIARYSQFSNPPAVAIQSAQISDCLPGFLAENKLAVLDAAVQPRIWMGNTITTPAHIDESNNLACVVSGSRRFTLFPPAQVGNLYLGPVDFTPTGSPISMAPLGQLHPPDFARFPNTREALAAAQVAELGPGDAIYIPTLWWHQVESLGQLNILVNYWWKGEPGSATKTDSAFDCLLHALLNMNALPPEQKAAWRAIFDYYLFETNNDPATHIAEHRRGVLGKPTPELQQEIKTWLVRRLQGDFAR